VTITIRDLQADDEDAWRTLWDGYCEFYGTRISPAITDATWRRLMDGDSPLFGLVACEGGGDGPVVGIVNCVLHPVTWSDGSACYLEDLFVDPEHRRKGAGRELIRAVLERGERMGWYRVYWMTKADNVTARSLYDAVAGKTDWVRYQVAIGDGA
jgi:GNAT superfamily N-acetyltransferase